MPLLVLVAHDGKTLQLDVAGATRVDAVQGALVAATGIAVADQILMCHGARLDPSKSLAAYKLPAADDAAAEDAPLFLYHKAFLRPGAAPPPQEPLPMMEVAVPPPPAQPGLRHPLQSAHSPLIRALPDYEAQFDRQVVEAQAYLEASSGRLARCRQLMSEQEVQARAADAARANVEGHYSYIAALYAGFVDRYVAQHKHHAALLAQFGELSAALSSLALPPQLACDRWRVLADLQPRVRLADWHESCARSHEHFAAKVVELEGVFQLLRSDVERLFLQAPRVDLDALGGQLGEAEAAVEEQASIVAVLRKDLDTVRSLVESVVAQLGSSAGGASLSGAAVHDSCAAVDTLLEQHLTSLLPRVRAADASVAEFLLRCGEAKACMTRDVLEQLQGIAAQQSRIRDMKHKLGLLAEVLARTGAAFEELAAANRLPAAYRLALAECARRGAWREMYAAQAGRLAEHCARITAKEAAKREAVNRQLERALPHDLLAAAGLLQEPPHCSVSLPPAEGFLLPVSPADISRLPAAIQAAADAAAAAAADRAAADAAASSSSILRRRSGSTDGTPRSSSTTAAGAGASPGRASSSGVPPPPPQAAAAARSSVGAALAPGGGLASSAAVWLARPDGAASVAALPAAAGGGGGVGGMSVLGGGGAAAGAVGSSGPPDLELENARLRAELAGVLAQQALRELGGDATQAPLAGGGAASTVFGASTSSASQLLSGASAMQPAGPGTAASSLALAASSAAPPSSSSAAEPAPRYGHGGAAGAGGVPASVAAPLPSVSDALSRAEAEAAASSEAASAAAAQHALALAPVRAALAAKDGVIAALEARIASLEGQVAACEARQGHAAGSTPGSSRRSSSGVAAMTADEAVAPAAGQQQQPREPPQQQARPPLAPQEQQPVDARPPGSDAAPAAAAAAAAAAGGHETSCEEDAAASSAPPAAAVAPPPSLLSVSEPDLRDVLVAAPEQVEAAHSREPHRASLDAGTSGGGGLTGLLSSMFLRSGSTSGSRPGSTGGAAADTPVVSPQPNSP